MKYKKKYIQDLETLQDNLEQLKVKCSCGHTKVMPAFVDSVICNYCGKRLHNNTKAHFLYKLRKELKRNEK
jgi:hypothetical protein